MVNRKKCYVVLSSSGSNSRTISLRLPTDYPLGGDSIKLLLEEIDLKKHSEDYTKVLINLKKYMKDKRNGINDKRDG